MRVLFLLIDVFQVRNGRKSFLKDLFESNFIACEELFVFYVDIFVLGFSYGAENTDCGTEMTTQLQDFGNNISLEGCKIKCVKLSNCTDILWTPSNGNCKAYSHCENTKSMKESKHYSREGN